MNIYERFGRATESLGVANEQVQLCMQLLMAIKSGEIHVDRVTINKDGWTVAPESTDEPGGGSEVEAEVAGQIG